MARNRLPVEIKEKRGTLEKSRELKEGERMAPEKVSLQNMKVPGFLNKYGRDFYRFYYQELAKLDVLTVTDLEALGMMASEYGRYIEAQYELKNNGLITKGVNKQGAEYEQVSPYVNIANTAYKNFYNMMSRFGVSPADRQKIASFVPDENGKDGESLLDFLKSN